MSAGAAENVALVRNRVCGALDHIARQFVDGVKITLIVRQPGKPEQDFMLSDDLIDEAIAVLERSKGRQPS